METLVQGHGRIIYKPTAAARGQVVIIAELIHLPLPSTFASRSAVSLALSLVLNLSPWRVSCCRAFTVRRQALTT